MKIIIRASILFVVFLLLVGCYGSSFPQITLNDSEINKEEFDWFLEKSEGYLKYLNSRKNMTEDEKKQDLNKTIDETLNEIVKFHGTYDFAVENGYIEKGSFSGAKERCNAINLENSKKKAQGQAVFGLQTYNLSQFIDYEIDGFENAFANDGENINAQITEKEREEHYENIKNTYFSRPDDITLQFIRIPFELEELGEEVAQLKVYLEELRRLLLDGDDISQFLNENKTLKNYYYEEEVNSDNYSIFTRNFPDIQYLANDLQVGEATEVIINEGYLYMIYCKTRTPHEYYELEQVKDYVDSSLLKARFQTIVDKNILDAGIVFNNDRLADYIANKSS